MRKIYVFTMGLVMATIVASSTDAKVIGKTVTYSSQGTELKGYLAYDDAVKGKRPGILVVHDWWGLNDYPKKRADMLAESGYTALALDMYGAGKTAVHPDDAGKFSSELMNKFEVAKERFNAGQAYLKKQATVDPDRIAAIGYCFGGGVVLNMAGQGNDLKAVVSFHGMLGAIKPAPPGGVRAKILVLHGGNDKFTTPEQVESFKNEMKAAGADYKFIVYPEAMHAFTNPEATKSGKKYNIPLAYNEKADRESWNEMQGFLKQVLG